jgi:hypothetical protein
VALRKEGMSAMKATWFGLMVLLVSLITPLPGVAPGIARAENPPPKIELPRAGFNVIANDRGVVVYQNEGADLVWIGAVGMIPAPTEKVYAGLLDYEHQVGKIGRVSEVNVLEREEGALYVYQRLNLPVISDRDFTLRVTHGNDAGRRWIAYWAVTDHGPKPRSGIVRVTKQRGVWELLPLLGGKATLARFEFKIDLGGDVPMWLAKSNAGSEIPELFSQVCKMGLGAAEQSACP